MNNNITKSELAGNDKSFYSAQKRDGAYINERFYSMPERFLESIADDPLFQPVFVTEIGYFPCARGHHRHREAGHKTFLLMYCASGEGSVELGGELEYPVTQGQITILPPDVPHTYYASDVDPWSIYWVHFGGDIPGIIWNRRNLKGALPMLKTGQRAIEALFHECLDVVARNGSIAEYYYSCQIVSHILGAALASVTDSTMTHKGELAVQTAISYMKENLHRSVTLSELSSVTHYSASYLLQLFQKITQSSPIEYFLRLKIQQSSSELYFTDRSIKDIAISYGFSDPLYFSRLFKRFMGSSPRAYREQNRR